MNQADPLVDGILRLQLAIKTADRVDSNKTWDERMKLGEIAAQFMSWNTDDEATGPVD